MSPVRDRTAADYPRGAEAAAARGCSRWLVIGGILFLLVDAVAIGYVVLEKDSLLTSGEDYSTTHRSVSMGMMVYR